MALLISFFSGPFFRFRISRELLQWLVADVRTCVLETLSLCLMGEARNSLLARLSQTFCMQMTYDLKYLMAALNIHGNEEFLQLAHSGAAFFRGVQQFGLFYFRFAFCQMRLLPQPVSTWKKIPSCGFSSSSTRNGLLCLGPSSKA